MLQLTEDDRASITGFDLTRSYITKLAARFVAALAGPDPLHNAFEEISDDLSARGLEILLNNDNTTPTLPLLAPLDRTEMQTLIDDIFSALRDRKVGFVLLSQFLARIWLSTRLLPSQVTLKGIADVSSYPFATTPTSNINQGTMVDGTSVAMKTSRRSQTQPVSDEDVKRFFFEAVISSATRHRNIMPSLGMHADTRGNIYLISKLHERGSLPDHLAQHPEADRLVVLEKVASAVAHLHSLAVLHGDVRGMNVLMDDEGEPLLIDMGYSLAMDPLTLEFSPESHLYVGNPRWTPWEKICPSEFPLSLKADSFSFASFMLEVLSGDIPYRHLSSDSAVIVEVLMRRRLPSRPTHPQLTDALWELMTRCWSVDPALRPSMEDIHRSLVSVRSELASRSGKTPPHVTHVLFSDVRPVRGFYGKVRKVSSMGITFKTV
ncbi:hypothetical protein DXG01_007785 [Tephrocybe rancida]|nr:hypothetical protein DXG01_007785 [Tephrocybe rancida]